MKFISNTLGAVAVVLTVFLAVGPVVVTALIIGQLAGLPDATATGSRTFDEEAHA